MEILQYLNSDIEKEKYLFVYNKTHPNLLSQVFPSLTREGIFVVSFERGELNIPFL